MSFKFSDILYQYDGSGDFSEWIRKLELVARSQKITDLENFLPLFLSEGAFSVYENLDENVKSSYEKLKAALLSCFSLNAFQAYKKFTSRCLKPGESVDVFAADLKRLASFISSTIVKTVLWSG
jgi:hypothetical protein